MARALLGSRIVVRHGAAIRLARIVETEAYVRRDPASHAFRGATNRNRSMFAGPGRLYVYRIHQVHCANVVTRSGTAVLLRAAEPISEGLDSLRGPGRLCRELGITRAMDGLDLTDGLQPVGILPVDGPRPQVVVGTRVGIRRATERRLRFAVRGNPHVSRPLPLGWSLD